MSVEFTQEDGERLFFTIKDVDVSTVNAIRRTIISEIPTVVFKALSCEEETIAIKTNTTRLNNEILKQRIGCIPIHICDIADGGFEDLEATISKKNTTTNIQYVTTEDIKIRNVNTGKDLTRESTKKVFPPDKKTGDYIVICRLRPKISDDIDGEELDLKATMSLGTAKEDGMYNVASTCVYTFTADEAKQKTTWSKHLKELKLESEEEIEREKRNWYLLEGKRVYKRNSFDFIIETVGVFTSLSLVVKACQIVIHKLRDCATAVENGQNAITLSKTTIKNAFDVRLENEDYTLGHVLQNILHQRYYKGQQKLSYLGFKKFHPHDAHSILRLGLKDSETGTEAVKEYISAACAEGVQIFEKLISELAPS